MRQGGGSGKEADTSELSRTGLTLHTWSLSLTASGLMTFRTVKGQRNLEASLIDSICRERSQVETAWIARSLPFVSLPDADKVVSVAEVEFGENSGPLKQLKHTGDEKKGVLVHNSDVVKSPVISARA